MFEFPFIGEVHSHTVHKFYYNLCLGKYEEGPITFIRGANSEYIVPDKHTSIIEKYFPFAQILTIDDAGHWVHGEKPHEFAQIVSEYLNKSDKLDFM